MKVRQFEKSDAHFLIDVDCKGNEFPFAMEDWEVAFNAVLEKNPKEIWRIDVATVGETPRGYSFVIVEKTKLFLIRLVVTPTFQKQGLGSALLDRAIGHARTYAKPVIQTIVPELDCQGKPGDMGQWLLSKGFKCVRRTPDMFDQYGCAWDGLTFELELG